MSIKKSMVIMANYEHDHFILRYLDVVCRTKYHTKHNKFAPFSSFDKQIDPTPKNGPNTPLSVEQSSKEFDAMFFLTRVNSEDETLNAPPSPQDLPIHDILRLIQTHQRAKTAEELKDAAIFFEPLILHYPLWMTLMYELRRDLRIIQKKKDCDDGLKQLKKNLRGNQGTSRS